MQQITEILLETRQIKKHFPLSGNVFGSQAGAVKAVDGVDMGICRGETLGLVGESGCGKSTLSRLVLRLIEPTSGQVFFEGQDITSLNHKVMRRMRQHMQLIFQDPFSSLDPRMKIGRIIGEPLSFFGLAHSAQEKQERVEQLLADVGLNPEYADRYPHEFSGGQRQRVSIARALASSPKLVICDEPVSALDVSVRSQVLNLMSDLQDKFDLTYLFITHDLSVAEFISNRMAVMYLGRMVEVAAKNDFYANPLHPYAQALLSALPLPDLDLQKKRIVLSGDVPTPINPPPGCHFHPRCRHAMPVCSEECPQMRDMGNEHYVACHLYA